MKYIASLFIIILTCSCKPVIRLATEDTVTITIDTILKKKVSIRAIIIDKDRLWYAGDKNRFGYYDLETGKIVEQYIKSDSLNLEFRSIAKNKEAVFIANIGNPAQIFRINKQNLNYTEVYSETDKKAFYDSMNFWNEDEGIAIGDPTKDCLSILITRDGGKSWKKLSCDNLPKVTEGEAAFAASNSNICIKGNNTWVVSGGIKSRVFFSADKGKNWQVYNTPIVQGSAMTGIFTAAFYDEMIGVIAGGNYEIPNQDFQNKAITDDGGKTWHLIADNSGFGYASCIQFVPNSGGKELAVVGATGLYYSSDAGKSWKKLSDDKTLFTMRFLNKNTAFAAGKDKIIKISFKK